MWRMKQISACLFVQRRRSAARSAVHQPALADWPDVVAHRTAVLTATAVLALVRGPVRQFVRRQVVKGYILDLPHGACVDVQGDVE